VTIKNRKGQNLVVLVEVAENPKGLAIVMHGLSGNKEQPHIVTFAEAFKEKGYTVVRFDTTNTFGESDGEYKDATITSYYEDLEDVIAWTKTQTWYLEPFVLAGHSLGGISIILYAENHPQKLKGLAPISTVVSGKLSKETLSERPALRDWEKTGWRVEESSTSPTGIKKLPWSYMIDSLKYDVLPEANKLSMPVLLIVGDKDDGTPYEQQKLFYDKLSSKKDIHVIKDAPHTFKEQEHLAEIKEIFLKWIDSLR
jgi:pimeloyl-ACP methyl ester carboxylesterase